MRVGHRRATTEHVLVPTAIGAFAVGLAALSPKRHDQDWEPTSLPGKQLWKYMGATRGGGSKDHR